MLRRQKPSPTDARRNADQKLFINSRPVDHQRQQFCQRLVEIVQQEPLRAPARCWCDGHRRRLALAPGQDRWRRPLAALVSERLGKSHQECFDSISPGNCSTFDALSWSPTFAVTGCFKARSTTGTAKAPFASCLSFSCGGLISRVNAKKSQWRAALPAISGPFRAQFQ